MLGAIIGDVAGSTYEVEEIKTLKEKKINYLNRIRILDKNTPLFDENSWYSDDTILTVAIANALLNDKNYYKHLKEFGLKELSLGLDKYGRNRFSKGFCDWLIGNYIGQSYGNGCVMRISPIANYFDDLDKIIDETFDATYPSHNTSEAYYAAEMVSICIYLARHKNSKESIKKYIETNCGYKHNFNLEELQKNYKFSSKAKDSVPQAIFCFLESNDFEDAIRKAISIGGDSDTIANITGAIAEAYYGIPEDIIKEVEKFLPKYIIDIVNEFYYVLDKKQPFNYIQQKQLKKTL